MRVPRSASRRGKQGGLSSAPSRSGRGCDTPSCKTRTAGPPRPSATCTWGREQGHEVNTPLRVAHREVTRASRHLQTLNCSAADACAHAAPASPAPSAQAAGAAPVELVVAGIAVARLVGGRKARIVGRGGYHDLKLWLLVLLGLLRVLSLPCLLLLSLFAALLGFDLDRRLLRRRILRMRQYILPPYTVQECVGAAVLAANCPA